MKVKFQNKYSINQSWIVMLAKAKYQSKKKKRNELSISFKKKKKKKKNEIRELNRHIHKPAAWVLYSTLFLL